ncbi:MAG: DUF167 family protein [Gemmatimonadota bacterium]|nr:DUF167 family protein [Gemmatimonadota bacterium]
MSWIVPTGDGARLTVRVQPRASRTGVVGPHGDALKIRLSAPPVDGAANVELIAFLAKRLRVPKSSVSIVSGDRSRRKVIEIADATAAAVVAALLPPHDIKGG